MLSYHQFVLAVRASIARFANRWLNEEQDAAVANPPHPPTFIVAGPGTGKTTVLALRVLKLIFVDGMRPERIIATTFTRKAAGELRSRILSWGYSILLHLRAQFDDNPQLAPWLRSIDINAIKVGTLDSLSEEFLTDTRLPGTITPTAIEAFLASGMMLRYGLFTNGRYANQQLRGFLTSITPSQWGTGNVAWMTSMALSFADRVRHDSIDLQAFSALGPGQRILAETVIDYFAHLEQNHYADFGRLERLLLERILAGNLRRITDSLQAILVDEFQDTNYLQEQIYFSLVRASNASLTVVGDDDQSIFRFRGATVEIFSAFESRVASSLGADRTPQRVNLHRNYRSGHRIVGFCNSFVQLDPSYQAARVPGKLPLIPAASHADVSNSPVLGMFRSAIQTLATDLGTMLHAVFRGNGYDVVTPDSTYTIRRAPDGDFGDSVLLTHSAAEFTDDDPTKPRLPFLLRSALESQYHVPVFNPRGRSLSQILSVQRLLGLALECIDPNGTIQQNSGAMSPTVIATLNLWRAAGQQYAASNPQPGGLPTFLANWQARTIGPGSGMRQWPPEWPLLELLFTLITWLPEFQVEPEGQVYLEAIARTISEAGQLGSFNSMIVSGQFNDPSVKHLVRGVFEPIANGLTEVDEEIMPYVPRSYFPIMTIHQAKGLEFPLVIVDIGSRWKRNHPAQAPLRFPVQGDGVHMIEDCVAPYCPVGNARTQRTQVQRAWDDLRRLYFVSYSRAQNVLLLVGLTTQVRLNPVRSVATGDMPTAARGLEFVPREQWHSAMGPNTVALI
jgi:DNA helicase II / ATP-dependent DNA helicase PcrA